VPNDTPAVDGHGSAELVEIVHGLSDRERALTARLPHPRWSERTTVNTSSISEASGSR